MRAERANSLFQLMRYGSISAAGAFGVFLAIYTDQPRLFRVIPAEGIINRMGFNNKGVDNLVENVKKCQYKA